MARGQYDLHRYYSPAVQRRALRAIALRVQTYTELALRVTINYQVPTVKFQLSTFNVQLALNRQPGYRQGNS